MSSGEPSPLYDLIGLGFGPANVAIAGALVEKWEASDSSTSGAVPRNVLFIEKQPEFRWHPGMLLPNSRMQISFLKDLATLRSPQSPITFLAYLHSQGRLLNFINRGSFTPTRQEYSDYLAWAADLVEKKGVHVRYGEAVVELTHNADGTVEVRSRDVVTGIECSRRSRNIIISPGGSPSLPPALSTVAPHPRLAHSAAYLTSVAGIFDSFPRDGEPLRIAVIGAGQSSTEVLMDLQNRLNAIPVANGKQHQLDMIFRKGSLKPSDDTPFSNEIFDPASTDMMFGLRSQRERDHVLREYQPTNYSVVNQRTIDNLYEIMYHQKLLDNIEARTGVRDASARTRITLVPNTSIFSAEALPGGSIRLILHGLLTRGVAQHTYDAVFCGTGYDRDAWIPLLAHSNLAAHLGLASGGAALELVAEGDAAADGHDSPQGGFSSAASTDGSSTPPTPVSPAPHALRLEGEHRVRISRNYRLLPRCGGEGADAPRIFLQGCTQATHGISESLLSILGVRAGSVVDELCGL